MRTYLRTLLTAIAFLACYHAMAQNPKLEIRRPRIINAIEVISDEVNLRKAPSSTAPKLLWWCEGETDCCDYVWSAPNKYRGARPATAHQGEVFAVIGETPEWYEIITHYYGMVAYISKQFTKKKELEEIFPETLSKPGSYDCERSQIPGIQQGEYKGYALIQKTTYEDSYISFGRIINGFLVCNWTLYTYVQESEKPGRFDIYLEYDNQSQTNQLHILAGNDVCQFYKDPDQEYAEDYAGDPILDMTKATTSEFATMLKKAGVKPGKTCDKGVIFTKIDGEVKILAEYDLSDPAFKDRIVTFPAEYINQ